MEKILIEPTKITPLIRFDPKNGILEIKGRSSPENSVQFYRLIIEALDDFSNSRYDTLTANFAYEYFNTSSSKCLFDILKRMKKIDKEGKNLIINWFYEEDDEDMMEAGEDYSELLEMDFNFVEIEE